MSFSAEGYNSSVADMLGNSTAARKEILQMLRPYKEKLEKYATATQSSSEDVLMQDPLPMSRRLILPNSNFLNQRKLLSLSRLYSQDQQLANHLLATLDDVPHDEKNSKQLTALRRCAIRELIEDSTDRFTQAALIVRPMSQIPELEALLEDFFDVCQNPNPAEYALFGDLIGFEEEYIEEWFARRRNKLRSLFVARAVICDNGDMGDLRRKQRMMAARRKKKPITVH